MQPVEPDEPDTSKQMGAAEVPAFDSPTAPMVTSGELLGAIPVDGMDATEFREAIGRFNEGMLSHDEMLRRNDALPREGMRWVKPCPIEVRMDRAEPPVIYDELELDEKLAELDFAALGVDRFASWWANA